MDAIPGRFLLNEKTSPPEPFDTTFFDTDTILIPSSTEISIPIRYWYYTGPIIPILIRYWYLKGLKILILIRYRYFMEMVWYHVWYPKIWILGYFKLFIAIRPFQNDHSSDVFGAKNPQNTTQLKKRYRYDTDTFKNGVFDTDTLLILSSIGISILIWHRYDTFL